MNNVGAPHTGLYFSARNPVIAPLLLWRRQSTVPVPARQEAAGTVECCARERTVFCGWAVGYESATRKHTLGEVLTTKMYLTSQNSAIRARVKTCVEAVLACCVGNNLLRAGSLSLSIVSCRVYRITVVLIATVSRVSKMRPRQSVELHCCVKEAGCSIRPSARSLTGPRGTAIGSRNPINKTKHCINSLSTLSHVYAAIKLPAIYFPT